MNPCRVVSRHNRYKGQTKYNQEIGEKQAHFFESDGGLKTEESWNVGVLE
jgi:hypothetical protein